MVSIQLVGYVTENGELKVELPKGIPSGQVRVTLETDDVLIWTDEELAALRQPSTPKQGAEIVAWLKQQPGWEHLEIEDGAAWVEALRQQRRERNQW